MSRPIFIVNNISKKFKTGSTDFYALKNITLEINNTGLVSITGKSGSGKSTFLNLLSGIERPSKGSVYFNNKNISKLSDKKFSKYHLNDMSLIFQHYNLFHDLTGLENVLLPLKMRGESKSKSLKKANDLFSKFKIENLKNKKVKNLSGGEKQRIAILRALITEPKVILCDEPTGALDVKNSMLIMDNLKEISKTKLVIVVSHNIDIVNKYSDRIISFKDGKIESDKYLNKIEDRYYLGNSKHQKYSSNWMDLFINLNLIRNKGKIILSLLTFVIGFSAVFLSIGFSFGAKESQNKALNTNLAINYSTVSQTSYISIENSPLSFEKNIRPSAELIDEKLKNLDCVQFADNLSYFFTNFPNGKYKNKTIDGFEMVPLYNIAENNYRSSLLISGNLPYEIIDEVIVNKEFVDLLDMSYEKVINTEFNISYSTNISVSTGDEENPIVKDTFSYNLNVKITGVVNEFSFLNTPKIYYSYLASKQFLQEQYSEVISKAKGEYKTYYDLILDAEDDNVVGSYSSILFLNSLNEKDDFFSLIKQLNETKDNLKITSSAYDIQDSYNNFIGSFTSALYVFVLIAFVGINFIIGMISLSNFIQNKKESAILTCLGARNQSIISIYLIENYIVLLVTLFASIFLSQFLQKILNSFIYTKFCLLDLINIPFDIFYNIKFGLPVIIGLISIFSISLFTLVPLFIYRKVSLSDELRDE